MNDFIAIAGGLLAIGLAFLVLRSTPRVTVIRAGEHYWLRTDQIFDERIEMRGGTLHTPEGRITFSSQCTVTTPTIRNCTVTNIVVEPQAHRVGKRQRIREDIDRILDERPELRERIEHNGGLKGGA